MIGRQNDGYAPARPDGEAGAHMSGVLMAHGLRYRVAAGQAGRGAGGCHSLTVRLAGDVTAESVHARARTAAGPHEALAGLRVWREPGAARSDDPAALDRLRTEAQRPLHGARPVRAVLVEHADGVADLVLVARRSALGGAGLRQLAAVLTGGRSAADGLPGAADRPAPVATLPDPGPDTAPEWGLGDPDARGAYGEVAVEPLPAAVTDELLLAATAVTVGRHGDTAEPELAVWSTADSGTDHWVHRVDCHPERTVREHLAQYPEPADGAPAGRVNPWVGVVLDEDRPGEHYRPFLAPPLPALVVWRRAADGTVRGTLHYRERDLAPAVARDLAAHLALVAGQLAASPDLALGDVELIGEAERERLLRAGATPAAGDPAPDAGRTVHELFARVAARQPEAVALVDEDGELGYAELDRRADRVAAGLRTLGAAPGDTVVVALERTAELVVVLLGVLKAGCAYVPVDIRYPAERLRYTVEDAGAKLAVALPGALPETGGVRVVSPEELSGLADAAAPGPDGVDGAAGADGAGPAYVIYTSGSTGRPKGVVVPHRNVAALVEAATAGFGLGGEDTWTFFHSCAFDFSVWEIWGCLLTGGRLVVVPYWASRDTEVFYELVERRQVTVLSQTPSAFAQFIEADARHEGRLALRLVVFGGEPLDTGMLAAWFTRHSHTACRLSNMFGITETTVHVTEQTLSPAEVVSGSRSVGRALPGWSLSVRDPRGRVLPAGVAGEIFVGGAGVAQGYLNRPELTAERFVTDPDGARVYRSGDLGRLRPDGRLDHLGRIDSQVKLRGHRIELDEIRGVLLGHPAVAAAAVALRHATEGDRDTARLDAYFVVRGGGRLDGRELRAHAAGMLPEYMLPATFTRIDAIPLTANGKADLAVLAGMTEEPAGPAPADPSGPSEAANPAEPGDGRAGDPTATAVLAVWERLLNTEVGLRDNFFELGGNSLLVVRLLRELREQGLPRVSMQDFYRNSVAAQFVEVVRNAAG
ncbi:amino acid adenylation domain-containing protein [Kitasatospora sp. NPDC008115]|uniref:amino acid adenylation domain-containing protein n=1 Tax=Kitasatospora sp. NPDC008115 TaxID=3364022 RepID=UPI0036EBDC20